MITGTQRGGRCASPAFQRTVERGGQESAPFLPVVQKYGAAGRVEPVEMLAQSVRVYQYIIQAYEFICVAVACVLQVGCVCSVALETAL